MRTGERKWRSRRCWKWRSEGDGKRDKEWGDGADGRDRERDGKGNGWKEKGDWEGKREEWGEVKVDEMERDMEKMKEKMIGENENNKKTK